MHYAHRFIALALLALSAPAFAQPADGLGAGAALPEATRTLSAADGASVTLSGAAGQNGLVVVFWSNVCPWADRYAERVAELADSYVPAGIGFVAVNPNDASRFPEEGPEGMQQAATAAGFAFPYVVDDGGTLARAFHVRSAPTVYFFDAAGTLVYEGAIDDSPSSGDDVEAAYLEDAMDQHLAGRPVEVQRTAALGCTLRLAGGR